MDRPTHGLSVNCIASGLEPVQAQSAPAAIITIKYSGIDTIDPMSKGLRCESVDLFFSHPERHQMDHALF
jgi:hypothetical protein